MQELLLDSRVPDIVNGKIGKIWDFSKLFLDEVCMLFRISEPARECDLRDHHSDAHVFGTSVVNLARFNLHTETGLSRQA